MNAGLQIYLNNGGEVQIDDNFFNLAFKSKHQVPCTWTWGRPSGSLTVQGTFPVVAFRGSQYASLHSIVQSGNTFTFNFQVPANASTTLTVYVFDIPTTSGTFGLQTFDSTGKLTFDSLTPYMKIALDVRFSDYNTYSPQVLPVQGRTYAIMASNFVGLKQSYFLFPGESDQGYIVTEDRPVMYYTNDSFIFLSEFQTFSNQTSIGNSEAWEFRVESGSIQVLDVTDL